MSVCDIYVCIYIERERVRVVHDLFVRVACVCACCRPKCVESLLHKNVRQVCVVCVLCVFVCVCVCVCVCEGRACWYIMS